jgi:arginine:pyruvate transaminase
MRFAPLVERVAGKGAGAWGVHIEAMKQRQSGRQVIFLTVGDPDQPPPAPIIDATVASLKRGRTNYTAIVGYPDLRAAIAARFARRTGVACTPDNVVVAPGTQGGLYAAMQCLAGAGDEVIALEPAYATYEAVIGASGATMVTSSLRPERGFHPDLDSIARAITPRTRVIWINSPHNPTGAVFSREEIEAIAALCRKHDLWLLTDEVYEDLAYARPHVSAWSLPGMAERTVVVSSLSKSHAIPGYRLGWIIGPVALARHLFNLLLCMLYGGPGFIQDGALAALTAPGGELPDVAALREDYRRRAALMSGILAEAPNCRHTPPEGGMFVFLDVRGTGLGSEEIARLLLEREAVAVLPADGFGPSAAGHLRISLSAADAVIADAGQRIVRLARQLAQKN